MRKKLASRNNLSTHYTLVPSCRTATHSNHIIIPTLLEKMAHFLKPGNLRKNLFNFLYPVTPQVMQNEVFL